MNSKIILSAAALMIIFIVASCVLSESSWAAKEKSPDMLAETVGLSSIVVGNLNPATRNPGLELFCTSLYDVPGGFCNYYAPGVPSDNFKVDVNVTVSGIR